MLVTTIAIAILMGALATLLLGVENDNRRIEQAHRRELGSTAPPQAQRESPPDAAVGGGDEGNGAGDFHGQPVSST